MTWLLLFHGATQGPQDRPPFGSHRPVLSFGDLGFALFAEKPWEVSRVSSPRSEVPSTFSSSATPKAQKPLIRQKISVTSYDQTLKSLQPYNAQP